MNNSRSGSDPAERERNWTSFLSDQRRNNHEEKKSWLPGIAGHLGDTGNAHGQSGFLRLIWSLRIFRVLRAAGLKVVIMPQDGASRHPEDNEASGCHGYFHPDAYQKIDLRFPFVGAYCYTPLSQGQNDVLSLISHRFICTDRTLSDPEAIVFHIDESRYSVILIIEP